MADSSTNAPPRGGGGGGGSSARRSEKVEGDDVGSGTTAAADGIPVPTVTRHGLFLDRAIAVDEVRGNTIYG